ncbi:hypothetical protein CCACVL1_26628 [Corchorus capsularis]|uniref:Uncharacterized protein n=1 Tax=Corchorus capsularis TaxID=210143 RepID=A0A1R3GE29_COCAP|nr:hypothetical protein CCACVL1_26628 [Corchorus capsularis]
MTKPSVIMGGLLALALKDEVKPGWAFWLAKTAVIVPLICPPNQSGGLTLFELKPGCGKSKSN